jgi:hypothetical protein
MGSILFNERAQVLMIYEYEVKIECYIVFDSDDIPEGMSPEQYAEQCYVEGNMQYQEHEIEEL